MSKLRWDDPAAEQVVAGNVGNWSLRVWAKHRRQERDDEGLAAYIGCTVEELRRETAVGWLAPLQDELDRLTSELAKHQPEERVGRCGCEENGCVWGDMIQHGEGSDPIPAAEWTEKHTAHIAPFKPVWHWMDPACQDNNDANEFCPRCGWQLDHDTGIARRNAGTARVQRVRDALDGFDCQQHVGADFYRVRSAHELHDAIRAALDGPAEKRESPIADEVRAYYSDTQGDPPTLGSLRGIAPGMTGDKDSVAFVREQRDGGEAKPGDA